MQLIVSFIFLFFHWCNSSRVQRLVLGKCWSSCGLSSPLEHAHKDTTDNRANAAPLLIFVSWHVFTQAGAWCECPPPRLQQAAFHVDPTLQMSHGPDSSCSRLALKSLMGERQEGRKRQRLCVCLGACNQFCTFVFLSVLFLECTSLVVDNEQPVWKSR